tara:strand:- start:323 stop:580 length:258 start_codon:yes stop_codon:yes gene_type:complete
MIDTDQYEGHLPFTGDEMIWVWSKSGMNRMKSVKQFHVTARLLEDAPALLAEVKRLREGIADITSKWGRPSIIRGFIQDLQELIE